MDKQVMLHEANQAMDLLYHVVKPSDVIMEMLKESKLRVVAVEVDIV